MIWKKSRIYSDTLGVGNLQKTGGKVTVEGDPAISEIIDHHKFVPLGQVYDL